MNVAALFAGIGGIESGMEKAGHRTLLLCEILPTAKAVLERHFPGVRIVPDVRTLRHLPPETELLTAGFPCQDLSQAGATKGIEGSRSGLVGEVFRLLRGQRIPWVLLENVPFMLHLRKGAAMEVVLRSLEELGYRWAYRVVDARGFLPQRRRRVFFLASLVADPADVLLVDEERPVEPETDFSRYAHGFYWTEGVRGLGWAVDAVPTLKAGSSVGIASPPAILLPDGRIVVPDIRDGERLQGFPEGWSEAEGNTKGARWGMVGNAVAVPVAQWIGTRLSAPGRYDTDRDAGQVDGRWPAAARLDGSSRRVAVNIGEWPARVEREPLHRWLRHPGTDLSGRATKGFLGRLGKSRLRLPEGFVERVEAHLARVSADRG